MVQQCRFSKPLKVCFLGAQATLWRILVPKCRFSKPLKIELPVTARLRALRRAARGFAAGTAWQRAGDRVAENQWRRRRRLWFAVVSIAGPTQRCQGLTAVGCKRRRARWPLAVHAIAWTRPPVESTATWNFAGVLTNPRLFAGIPSVPSTSKLTSRTVGAGEQEIATAKQQPRGRTLARQSLRSCDGSWPCCSTLQAEAFLYDAASIARRPCGP
jgi:hypothetical protein